MRIYIQRQLIRFVAWISPLIGNIASPWTRKLITAEDYRSFKSLLLDEGTILITKTNGELGNLFIPDFWSHSAIYTGSSSVIEAIGKGVVETDLIDFMMKKDFIIAVKPNKATVPDMAKAVEVAKTQIGKPYDYSFKHSDVEAFYCSELIQWSYNQSNKEIAFNNKTVFGVITLTPDDLVGEGFEVVWASKSCADIK